MFVISIMGFAKGNYRELIAGVDSNGRICGNSQDPTVKDYPNFYYFMDSNLIEGATCVKTCPKTKSDGVECAGTTNHPDCIIAAGKGYATRDILNFCLPSDPKAIGSNLQNQFDMLMQN